MMKIAILLAGVFSFLGIADMPIGYYTFLRIYLTGIAAFIIFDSYSKSDKVSGEVIVFSVIAIIFNPFIPVYLHDKELWSAIDAVVGIVFLIKGFKLKQENK